RQRKELQQAAQQLFTLVDGIRLAVSRLLDVVVDQGGALLHDVVQQRDNSSLGDAQLLQHAKRRHPGIGHRRQRMTAASFQLVARLGNAQRFVQNNQHLLGERNLASEIVGEEKVGVAPRRVAGHHLDAPLQLVQLEAALPGQRLQDARRARLLVLRERAQQELWRKI